MQGWGILFLPWQAMLMHNQYIQIGILVGNLKIDGNFPVEEDLHLSHVNKILNFVKLERFPLNDFEVFVHLLLFYFLMI